MTSTITPWWERVEALGPWFKIGSDDVRLLRDGVEALPSRGRASASPFA